MEAKKFTTDTSNGEEVRKEAARSAERLASAAHEQVDRAVDAAHPAVDRLAGTAHDTVNKVAGAATAAAETVTARTEDVKVLQDRLAEDCRNYLRDHPFKALGIAAAAGFVLSRLFRI